MKLYGVRASDSSVVGWMASCVHQISMISKHVVLFGDFSRPSRITVSGDRSIFQTNANQWITPNNRSRHILIFPSCFLSFSATPLRCAIISKWPAAHENWHWTVCRKKNKPKCVAPKVKFLGEQPQMNGCEFYSTLKKKKKKRNSQIVLRDAILENRTILWQAPNGNCQNNTLILIKRSAIIEKEGTKK